MELYTLYSASTSVRLYSPTSVLLYTLPYSYLCVLHHYMPTHFVAGVDA